MTVVPSYDIDALREREFPWAMRGESIYLDHASTGPLPRRTTRAVTEFSALRAEPFRLSETYQFETLARARALCARLVGASVQEIALMVNTSYGINLAARALELQPGDVVLTFDREFPANIYPWMALERDGVRLERVPCIASLPDEDALLERLDRPGVRVVTLSWVQFATGYRADLARIGRACRDREITFVIDAIQGLGAAPLDVAAGCVDILACGGQKWLLSPWGTGFAYVREELMRRLEPHAVGWMAVQSSDDFSTLVDYDLTYREDARRFEVITLPFQEFAGLAASLELLLELGIDAVARHVERLADLVVRWASDRADVRLVTPAAAPRRAGIVAVMPRDAARASARLARAGVAHSLREGAIRLSPHCYNTTVEIERALDVLDGA